MQARWNSTLTTLDLGDNDVGKVLSAAGAGALERNTTLTTLNLRYNRFGEVGGAAVAGALEKNTTLTKKSLLCWGKQKSGVDVFKIG